MQGAGLVPSACGPQIAISALQPAWQRTRSGKDAVAVFGLHAAADPIGSGDKTGERGRDMAPNSTRRTRAALTSRVTVLAWFGCIALSGPLSAQPLQILPPKPAAAKPAGPRPLPLPPMRPPGLGMPRIAEAATVQAASVGAVAPAAAEAARTTQAPPVTRARSGAPATREEAIERLNAYLNSFTTLQGNFIQHAADGRRLEGRIYIQRPGKMRFEYEPPATIEVIADGTSVAVRDKRLATQDVYSLGQTPLKFLVRERMDLAREGTITGAAVDGDVLTLRLEDRTTLGGTSKIALKFDLAANVLRQWVVIDPQGYETSVSLYNLDTQRKPDAKNFVIDYQRKL